MIRYFMQGRFGPWYEVEDDQWLTMCPAVNPRSTAPYGEILGHKLVRTVWVNTSLAVKEDVKADFPGLQNLIWFPDMRCGDCNGRLIDENAYDPDKRYPRYVHATGMMDRHGAWPVEPWED